MKEKFDNYRRSERFQRHHKPWLVIAGALLGLYVLASFVILPVYTRHWQRIEVPDVTNLSGNAAEKLLKKRHLEPVLGEIKFDDRMPNGFVVFQSPSGESVVKKRRNVYLTLSKGKRPVIMPKLVGMNERDAKFLLTQNQLVLGNVLKSFDSYYPAGVVINQSVPPETEIVAGKTIDINVSTGAEGSSVIVPNVVGMTFENASMYIEVAGMSMGKVRYCEVQEAIPDAVISQSPEPGLHAAAGDSVDLVLSISPGEAGVEESAQ
jgi:eukaryotic-like serine/threonine-protein kinase